MVCNVEVGPRPNVADVIAAEELIKVLAHAKDVHHVRALQVLEIKHSHRRAPVGEAVELGLE